MSQLSFFNRKHTTAGKDGTSTFARRLDILMASLSLCIESAGLTSRSASQDTVKEAHPVFQMLLEAWEDLSTAEAAKQAEEAQQFKSKARETTFQTEDVSLLTLMCMRRTLKRSLRITGPLLKLKAGFRVSAHLGSTAGQDASTLSKMSKVNAG